MTANFRGKISNIGLPTFICCSGIPKRIRLLWRHKHINSANDLPMPTLCRNLVSFCPLTTKFTLLVCICVSDLQNRHIQPIISERTEPIFIKFSGLVWLRMINRTFILRLLKGRCYGNELISWANNEHSCENWPWRTYQPCTGWEASSLCAGGWSWRSSPSACRRKMPSRTPSWQWCNG